MQINKPAFTFQHVAIVISGACGRHPKLVGRSFGVMLALGVIAAALLIVLNMKIQEIDAGHATVLARMQAVQADTSALLGELNKSYPSDCSPDNLNRLRSLMFGHQYARNIGLLDAQRRLYCSTSIGLLAVPVALGGRAIDGSIGRYYTATPVELFNGSVHGVATATVVERGRFQVMIDGNPTRRAYQRYADAVWAGAGAQRRQTFKSARADSVPAGPETPHLQLDWRQARLLVTTTRPGVSPVSVQSVARLAGMRQDRQLGLLGVVVMAALLGCLLSHRVTGRCRHFHSMDFRIRYLYDASNVVCHYQPILDLASGRVKGCEVLARLQDRGELIYPDQFIPALTREKLTWAFDAAVSKCALQELAQALPPQTEFTVALNFFPQNLQRDLLHAHLQSAMQAVARPDLRIELEVTEYHFSPEIVPELSRLKADGYFVSIDDFGTGYSNLGMVKRVAPDYLKIDKSFVFEMEDVTVRSSLIPEIVAIAKAVGSQVIAEGIETAAQAEQLRALGVEYGQGYYFARPMPLQAFLRYLQEHDSVELHQGP